MTEGWAAFEEPEESSWTSFNENVEWNPPSTQDDVFPSVFGKTNHTTNQVVAVLDVAYPESWVKGCPLRKEKSAKEITSPSEQMLFEAMGVNVSSLSSSNVVSSSGCVITIINMAFQEASVEWKQEDWTLQDVYDRALMQWKQDKKNNNVDEGEEEVMGNNNALYDDETDYLQQVVLVDGNDDFVPFSQQLSLLPPTSFPMLLAAEPRVRYVSRRQMPLLERVAFLVRKPKVDAFKATVEAWRLTLDAGTSGRPADSTVALVSETTRLDGVRYVEESLMHSGDLKGVAVWRKVILPGVCRFHWILTVLFSPEVVAPPHLQQLGKFCPLSSGSPSVVLLQQKPLFYRTLLDCLVEPNAAGLRQRIDPTAMSSAIVLSLLTDMTSCRPSSVLVYLADMDTGTFGIEIGPEAGDTALSPYATYCERNEECAALCNILWMMQDEMERAVSPQVREFWLDMEVEKMILLLLEKCSAFNDQCCELFTPDEMQFAPGSTHFIPLLLRSGVGTNLLNKAFLLQSLLQKSERTTHKDLFRALHPGLYEIYEAASKKAKGAIMDVWRLVTRRSHVVMEDGSSVPNFRANPAERARLICGEDLLLKIDRTVLRKAVDREAAAVKLVAEVLKCSK